MNGWSILFVILSLSFILTEFLRHFSLFKVQDKYILKTFSKFTYLFIKVLYFLFLGDKLHYLQSYIYVFTIKNSGRYDLNYVLNIF